MINLKYSITISPLSENEGGGYFVEFPDLPGCFAEGETLEEALIAAEDALNSWLLTAKEFNDEFPAQN